MLILCVLWVTEIKYVSMYVSNITGIRQLFKKKLSLEVGCKFYTFLHHCGIVVDTFSVVQCIFNFTDIIRRVIVS